MLDEIFSILQDFPICAACLGRQYGSFLHGISNRSRGEALFLSLGMSLQKQVVDQIPGALVRFEKLLPVPFGVFHQSYPKIAASALIQPSDSNPIASVPTASLETMPTVSSCKICRGLLDVANLERYALQIDAHSQYYEFASYLVGSRISADIVEREEDFRAKFKLSHGESIKSDCNREIGKILQKFPRFAQKKVEFETPDLVFVVDFGDNIIRIQNNPLFILGKYMKLVRGIPQSVWFCRECWGKGCDTCDHTGRKFPDAVEEYCVQPLVRAAGAKSGKFHGSGREDVDALMLGDGRPFVAQLNEPKVRTLDIKALESEINEKAASRVRVSLEGFTTRRKVREIKGQSSIMGKLYRVGVRLLEARTVQLEALQSLVGEITQQTPQRVLKRRADLTRLREVFSIDAKIVDDAHMEIEIYCSGGLYVKELMHGDQGRTKPSLRDIIGVEVEVEFLDVLKVEELDSRV